MVVEVADGLWCNVLVEFTDGKTKIFENCCDSGYETTRKMFEIVVDGWRTFIPREVVKYVMPYDIQEVGEKEEWKNCETCKYGEGDYKACSKCTTSETSNPSRWEAKKKEILAGIEEACESCRHYGKADPFFNYCGTCVVSSGDIYPSNWEKKGE